MNIFKAEKIALKLATKYKLFGWQIWFSDIRLIGGVCSVKEQAIEFSKPTFLINSHKMCKNIILHEIAHALTESDHGDIKWAEKCREIGVEPVECCDQYSDVKFVDPKPEASDFEGFMGMMKLQLNYKFNPVKSEVINVIEREEK